MIWMRNSRVPPLSVFSVPGRPCPVCHGTGLVVVLLDTEPVEMQCGECLGTGEQDDDAALLG